MPNISKINKDKQLKKMIKRVTRRKFHSFAFDLNVYQRSNA